MPVPLLRPPLASRTGRRRAAAAAALLLCAPLAACGSDDDAAGPVGLEGVDVAGEVGSVPEVDLAEDLTADGRETTTVVEGGGAELAGGDAVIVDYWLGNGFDGEPVEDSYGPKTPGALVTVGEEGAQPQTVDQVLSAAASRVVEEGATVGSRIAAVGTAPELLGVPGLPELGVGNLDPVVLVVDVVEQPLAEPEGRTVDTPSWVPGLRIEDGAPVRWTFDRAPEPTDQLRSFTRIVGEGEEVEQGDLLVADYLGQVYGGDEPFDESYSAEPVGFGIGVGQVIEGWDEALVGQTVGSRVVLAIPPDLGYGEQGSPQAGIEGDDTLYFVVDILGAG